MISNYFGLLGRNIHYSFSKKYFSEKFQKENLLGYSYKNFDIQDIKYFYEIIKNTPNLRGLNVTIPYKETILPYLDKISKKAKKIGAVNTIKISKKGIIKGYNTDYYGFKKTLKPLLESHHKKALVLGTGGASKAIVFALEELGISYTFVSRETRGERINYQQIDIDTFKTHQIVINCTPLGTSPDVEKCPPLPYSFFTSKHIAYDLIYNPSETQFLKNAKNSGAKTKNGLEMLVIQAEKAWRIWKKQNP